MTQWIRTSVEIFDLTFPEYERADKLGYHYIGMDEQLKKQMIKDLQEVLQKYLTIHNPTREQEV